MQRICPILDRLTEVEPTEYSRDQWTIVRCLETGLVFLADPPDYSQLSEEYAWESTIRSNRKQRQQKQPVVAAVSALYKKIKKTLFPNRSPFFTLIGAHCARPQPADAARRRLRLGPIDGGCLCAFCPCGPRHSADRR